MVKYRNVTKASAMKLLKTVRREKAVLSMAWRLPKVARPGTGEAILFPQLAVRNEHFFGSHVDWGNGDGGTGETLARMMRITIEKVCGLGRSSERPLTLWFVRVASNSPPSLRSG